MFEWFIINKTDYIITDYDKKATIKQVTICRRN